MEMTTEERGCAIGRVRGRVGNVIQNLSRHGLLSRSLQPPKLLPQDMPNILRKAGTENYNTGQSMRIMNLNICFYHVRRLIRADPNLIWVKMNKKPNLTSTFRTTRLVWAQQHVTWNAQKRQKAIWTDEKVFNFDEPDGLACYWHNKRIVQKTFLKRHSGGDGGGSIMIWRCLSSHGCSENSILDSTLHAHKYCDVFESTLQPLAYTKHVTGEQNFSFGRDGTSCHSAHLKINFLSEINVQVSNWQTLSLDLNPIEIL